MRVVVGMSGGVDSSVSAALLCEAGHEVIGLFMKNWDEKLEQGSCAASQDFEDALNVAAKLNIPCYSVEFVQEYREKVFAHFLSDLAQGYTPNPDLGCNREIKFNLFFEKALSLGADMVATGHYCRVVDHHLHKGVDSNKDQSYFLYDIPYDRLKKTIFPVGALTKPQVRRLAEQQGLGTAAKKNSTGICFIGKRKFAPFVQQYLPTSAGIIKTVEGKIVGEHQGSIFFTIGQRKGLGIGGAGEPWFVVKKDLLKNELIVAQGEHHPALFASVCYTKTPHWLLAYPPSLPFSCYAKIRYRHKEVPCIVESNPSDSSGLLVRFAQPQRAITPGQAVVFYHDACCLGGSLIESVESDI